jgi:hypothetical protein
LGKPIDKIVYFLGAGASHASKFKLPCMNGFFRKNDMKSGNYPNLSEFIEKKFRKIKFRELNLEEVITFLELNVDTFGSFGEHPEEYIYEARREFDKYVNQRLNIPDLKVCNEHMKIIDQRLAGSDSKDSIITLNYDLVVDNILYELSPKQTNQIHLEHGCLLDRMYSILGKTVLSHGERGSLYHGYRGLGFYLKLHGSIDWLYCPNRACGNHQLFFPNWIGSNDVHNNPGDPCSLCGSPLLNVIVPPTMHKTFEKFPKLGLLWTLAYKELNKADRIVVFGVSFAPSDYYLRWIFKKAVRERVHKPTIFDIDTNVSVPGEIEKITGIKPIYIQSLDEFMERLSD